MERQAKQLMEQRIALAVNPRPGKGELVVLFSGWEHTLPAHNVGPQVRDYFLVHQVICGKGTFRSMGRTYTLGAGDSFFIFPGELIRYTADEAEPWTYRWVGFRGDRADALLTELGLSPYSPVARPADPRRAAVLFHRIERSLAQGGAGCDLEADGMLRMLLALYADGRAHAKAIDGGGAHSPIEQQVERSIRWLTLQYSQPVSIEQMAGSLGYTRTHLSKMFKQHTGMTPMQFLLKIRMERAKLLLREPLTVEQVAASVGYPDPLYFSKQFRKWFGRSPSEYRQEANGRTAYDCRE